MLKTVILLYMYIYNLYYIVIDIYHRSLDLSCNVLSENKPKLTYHLS